MIKHINTIAPSSPKTSMKIWRAGCPTGLETVLSKSWIEKRNERITNNPNKAENPIGADHDAFLVSLDKCANASKPVSVYCDMSAPQHVMYAGKHARSTLDLVRLRFHRRRLKDKFCTLVGWRLCQDCNCNRCHAQRVESNGSVIEVSQNVHAKPFP